MNITESKHKPLPIHLDRNSALTKLIYTKLANEVLQLNEFKSCFQDMLAGFTLSLKREIDEYSEKVNAKFMKNYQETLTQLQTSISCLLAKGMHNQILDLFKGCNDQKDVKNTVVLKTNISYPTLSITEGLKSSIHYEIFLSTTSFEDILNKKNRHGQMYLKSSHANPPIEQVLRTSSLSLQSNNKFRILGFSRPIHETIYFIQPFSSKISFYNIKEETINEFLIDSQKFPSKAGWSLSKDGKLILTGGFDESAKKTSFAILVNEKRIEELGKMITARFNHGQITIDHSVFVIGGMDKKAISDCEYFSTDKKKWMKFASLVVAREHPAVCHLLGKIYVAGGNGIATIECAQLNREKFELLLLRLPGPGKCNMLAKDNQILILYKGKFVSITLPNLAYKEFGAIENTCLWTCSENVIYDKKAYWVADGIFVSFDIESGEFKKIN